MRTCEIARVDMPGISCVYACNTVQLARRVWSLLNKFSSTLNSPNRKTCLPRPPSKSLNCSENKMCITHAGSYGRRLTCPALNISLNRNRRHSLPRLQLPSRCSTRLRVRVSTISFTLFGRWNSLTGRKLSQLRMQR
jgi:hypothetical protein